MASENRISRMIRRWMGKATPDFEDHVHQFPGATKDGLRHQLVIGLDFGTAFVKVIVGDLTDKQVVPLSGGQEHAGQYLMRGECTFLTDGTCRLGQHAGGRVVSDMKMRLIEGQRDTDTKLETICFLALVIRRVRLWVLQSRHRELNNRWIDWALNVGLPTASFEDDDLSQTYQDITRAAWVVSCDAGEITQQMAQQALKQVLGGKGELPTGGIGLFPEFAAQVAGYCESPQRRNGLHLLVDVGAGTVDDTVFTVSSTDEGERLSILARSVEPRGARFLIRHRLEALPNGQGEDIDEFGDIPQRQALARQFGVDMSRMEKVDEDFRKHIVFTVRNDLLITKRSRDPKARQWEEGVPTFLAGGGARMDVYQEVLKRISEGNGAIKLELVKVPEPGSLQWPLGRSNTDYDRFMVAYGLSMDADNIAEVVPSAKVPDIAPRNDDERGLQYRANYIDKDMV